MNPVDHTHGVGGTCEKLWVSQTLRTTLHEIGPIGVATLGVLILAWLWYGLIMLGGL